MVKPALCSKKGGVNILRALFVSKKYKTINYFVCRRRRYNRNILHWNKNDMKSMKWTTGDYYDSRLSSELISY